MFSKVFQYVPIVVELTEAMLSEVSENIHPIPCIKCRFCI
jgi:hypothetical protein